MGNWLKSRDRAARASLIFSLTASLASVACQDDCETTRSCTPRDNAMAGGSGDGDQSGDGDSGGDGDGDGDQSGNSGDGDSSGDGDGDGDVSGDGDGDGNVRGDGDGDTSGDGDGISGCSEEKVICEEACVDPLSDDDFCGATDDCQGEHAGEVCEEGWQCQGGTCVPVCEDGLLSCDGSCIDPMTDEAFCGALNDCQGRPDSGRKCDPDATCVQGVCREWGEVQTVEVGTLNGPSWLGLLSDGEASRSLLMVPNSPGNESALRVHTPGGSELGPGEGTARQARMDWQSFLAQV